MVFLGGKLCTKLNNLRYITKHTWKGNISVNYGIATKFYYLLYLLIVLSSCLSVVEESPPFEYTQKKTLRLRSE